MDTPDRKFDAFTINQDGQLMLAKAERDQVETVLGSSPGTTAPMRFLRDGPLVPDMHHGPPAGSTLLGKVPREESAELTRTLSWLAIWAE